MKHSHDSSERRQPARRPTSRAAQAWILGGAATALAASIGLHAAMTPTASLVDGVAAQSAQETQDEEAFAALGESTTEKACIACHPWETLTDRRRTVHEWDEVVANMVQRGASGSPQQFTIVTKFLARYYGLVHVNAASAEELSTVLGLTAKDAQAIVEHRQANGKFADAAALARVKGIDKTKIEERSDALIFD